MGSEKCASRVHHRTNTTEGSHTCLGVEPTKRACGLAWGCRAVTHTTLYERKPSEGGNGVNETRPRRAECEQDTPKEDRVRALSV